MKISPLVVVLFLLIACAGTSAWKTPNAPTAPPDQQYLTGVEAGELVYVWDCYQNQRVVVHQFGGCFGTREPETARGPCGAPLPVESTWSAHNEMPSSFVWPGSDAATPQSPPASK